MRSTSARTVRGFVVGRWHLPGRPLQVAIARAGGFSDGGGRVFRAWETGIERDSLLEAARFAAWPVTNARVVEAGTLAGLTRFAAVLRERLCDPASCLGVIVDRLSLNRLDRCPELGAIRGLAERARRLTSRSAADLDPEVKTLLDHVPTIEPATTVKDWLDLGTTEVLVVPRLGALARRTAFDEELHSLRVAAGLPR